MEKFTHEEKSNIEIVKQFYVNRYGYKENSLPFETIYSVINEANIAIGKLLRYDTHLFDSIDEAIMMPAIGCKFALTKNDMNNLEFELEKINKSLKGGMFISNSKKHIFVQKKSGKLKRYYIVEVKYKFQQLYQKTEQYSYCLTHEHIVEIYKYLSTNYYLQAVKDYTHFVYDEK